MNEQEKFELSVDYHVSGRWTLKEKKTGDSMWADLFSMTDGMAFYRAVAGRMASYSQDGRIVSKYKDTNQV